MEQLERLIAHIAARVNVNLRKPYVDVAPYVKNIVPRQSHNLYYAFYALSTRHPSYFSFKRSSLAGTYFLGKCDVDQSVLYKSDIRGDELKIKGSLVSVEGTDIKLYDDEVIAIKNSFLVKTLVHNYSHDPENLEVFKILNTVALHYANIHGAPVEGCFLGPFATVDLSMCRNCDIGAYSYVQAGEISHERIAPGRVWVRVGGVCEFDYSYPEGVVEKYVSMGEDMRPKGEFIDFFEERKEEFVPIYSSVNPDSCIGCPDDAYVSPYAVIKGDCSIGPRVLVSQRAYIENSSLGEGANAQEHCYIVDSVYDGLNVTAHGGKVIHCHMGRKVFTGFNSFLRGKGDAKISIGESSIVMPHTIIDAEEPVSIPAGSLVWGYIRKQDDLDYHSISLEELSKAKALTLGNMTFQGLGAKFVDAFRDRIEHILQANGAYYDGSSETKGHAQKIQNVSYNILQPFQDGKLLGMFPHIVIGPNLPDDF
jgi:carbonic anhydrase/acetyltransferase-like protein (isoleucine patch superfamily)